MTVKLVRIRLMSTAQALFVALIWPSNPPSDPAANKQVILSLDELKAETKI